MSGEVTGGADHDPSATASGIIFVVSFPGELRAGRSLACAVADIEEALERAEGDLAIGRALEGEMRLLEEIEVVGVKESGAESGKKLNKIKA